MPRADSTKSRSTPSTPTYALVRITGTARITSAIATFQKPMPIAASRMAMTARLGSARPTFETLIARKPPRWMWPSQIPIGSAIAAAIRKPAANSLSVWMQLSWSRSDQWSPMNSKALVKSFTSVRPRPRPRGQEPLCQRQGGVCDDAVRDRQRGRREQLGLERAAVDRVEDRRPQPLVDDERRHRREADHRDGRDLDPCED